MTINRLHAVHDSMLRFMKVVVSIPNDNFLKMNKIVECELAIELFRREQIRIIQEFTRGGVIQEDHFGALYFICRYGCRLGISVSRISSAVITDHKQIEGYLLDGLYVYEYGISNFFNGFDSLIGLITNHPKMFSDNVFALKWLVKSTNTQKLNPTPSETQEFVFEEPELFSQLFDDISNSTKPSFDLDIEPPSRYDMLRANLEQLFCEEIPSNWYEKNKSLINECFQEYFDNSSNYIASHIFLHSRTNTSDLALSANHQHFSLIYFNGDFHIREIHNRMEILDKSFGAKYVEMIIKRVNS